MGRKSHDRAMGNGCSLALAMFSCYAMLWDDMLRYAILASVVMNRLLSRGPLGQCRGSGGPVRAQRRDDTGAVAGRCRHSWARQGQWRGDELWLERSSKVRFGVRGVDLASHNKYGGLGVL